MDMLRENPPPYQALQEELESPPSKASAPAQQQHLDLQQGAVAPPYPQHLQQQQQPMPMTTPMFLVQQQPQLAAPAADHQTVVVVNNNGGRVGGKARCAACNYGQLKDHYSCCAICLCIFLFPIGGCLCCLCMRNKKCNHCGIEF